MQTYYQFYWNKIDEESIRILRIFGESEDVIVPETIGGRAVMEAGGLLLCGVETPAVRIRVHGLYL